MVRRLLCCGLLVSFVAVGCRGRSGPPRNTGSTSQEASALLVLPDAKDVKTADLYDGEVTYTLEDAWPAQDTIAFIERQLAAGGWQLSDSYLLGSDIRLRTWEPGVIVGQETVFSWWGQWSKSDGSVVLYALDYKVPGTTADVRPAGPLHVVAVFFSRATAEALREGVKKLNEQDPKLRP